MPFAQIDGIKTHYQVTGNGTPLLMLAPGGFDSVMAKWGAGGNATWKPLNPLQSLADEFKVIAYDRREAGESGGRIGGAVDTRVGAGDAEDRCCGLRRAAGGATRY